MTEIFAHSQLMGLTTRLVCSENDGSQLIIYAYVDIVTDFDVESEIADTR